MNKQVLVEKESWISRFFFYCKIAIKISLGCFFSISISLIGYIVKNSEENRDEIRKYNFQLDIDNYLTRKYNADIAGLLKKYRLEDR